jgi:DnaA family protein
MRQLPLGVQLRTHARFDTFVSGANASVLAHLRGPATQSTPVTWLWGGAASGKTHLLQALCADCDAQGRRAGYVPLGDEALRPQLLDGWDALEVVCADDLDRVVGDAAWERALFVLYNGLLEHAGALVVTSARSPAELAFTLPDLESRLRAGPVFQLAPLDDADRLTALRTHAAARGLELPEDAARYLLRHTRRDMHSLCGVLDALDRASLAAQRRLTVPFVRELLHEADDE